MIRQKQHPLFAIFTQTAAQCHNSCSKSLQQDQDNSGQLVQWTYLTDEATTYLGAHPRTPLGCANSILILNDKVHFWLASLNCTNVLVHGVTTVLICICIGCMFCGCAFLFERHWVHPHLMAKLEQVQNLNQILHWKILTINFHILDRTLLKRQAPLRKKRQNKVTLSP